MSPKWPILAVGPQQPKYAVLGVIFKFIKFFKFGLRIAYLLEFFSYDSEQDIKIVLNCSNFSKIIQKRAWHTHNLIIHITCNWLFKTLKFSEIFEISKISENFKVLKSQLQVIWMMRLWVCQALFCIIFEKFEQFKTILISCSLS